MVVYKTFTEHGGLTIKGVNQAQEKVRSQAQAFVNEFMDEVELISISESAFRSSWGLCYVRSRFGTGVR